MNWSVPLLVGREALNANQIFSYKEMKERPKQGRAKNKKKTEKTKNAPAARRGSNKCHSGVQSEYIGLEGASEGRRA